MSWRVTGKLMRAFTAMAVLLELMDPNTNFIRINIELDDSLVTIATVVNDFIVHPKIHPSKSESGKKTSQNVPLSKHHAPTCSATVAAHFEIVGHPAEISPIPSKLLLVPEGIRSSIFRPPKRLALDSLS